MATWKACKTLQKMTIALENVAAFKLRCRFSSALYAAAWDCWWDDMMNLNTHNHTETEILTSGQLKQYKVFTDYIRRFVVLWIRAFRRRHLLRTSSGSRVQTLQNHARILFFFFFISVCNSNWVWGFTCILLDSYHKCKRIWLNSKAS